MLRLDSQPNYPSLTRLFEEWRAAQPGHRLFLDGPVDGSRYAREACRLVFILKEVNVTPTEADWNLCEYVRDGGRAATWNNVARWTAAVLDKAVWNDVAEIDENRRKDILGRIAVVNLNKRGGQACTDYRRLARAVERDRERLRAERDILEPHVVLCGGGLTADLAGKELFDVEAGAWSTAAPGVWAAHGAGGVKLIAMPHPQARRAAREVFYGLLKAIQLLNDRTAARSGIR